jgi:hypothetical protein
LVRKLREVKDNPERGDIYIKSFPTGQATINDFRKYLRELQMRDVEPSILYVDYINLMRSAYSKYNDLYQKVKAISEELRALSFEFKIPVVSVSQLNRLATFTDFKDTDMGHVAESFGLPATADFMAVYGINEDEMVYQSQLFYRIIKNRLGGRVGQEGYFYYDTTSLKMYDSVELDNWIADSDISQDQRNLFEREENQNGN